MRIALTPREQAAGEFVMMDCILPPRRRLPSLMGLPGFQLLHRFLDVLQANKTLSGLKLELRISKDNALRAKEVHNDELKLLLP